MKNLPSPEELVNLSLGNEVSNINGVRIVAKTGEYPMWDTQLVDVAVHNVRITNQLMEINDDTDITDEEREKQLIETFRTIDIKVKFVD